MSFFLNVFVFSAGLVNRLELEFTRYTLVASEHDSNRVPHDKNIYAYINTASTTLRLTKFTKNQSSGIFSPFLYLVLQNFAEGRLCDGVCSKSISFRMRTCFGSKAKK